jgi:hypothetical protein
MHSVFLVKSGVTLLWILSYAFTKKNKHISGINISVDYKIVINSPEVHFGIRR